MHRRMINDIPRTSAYRDAIMQNCELFKDKIILDVGAGTGILSIFAARAGAKQVYAVECSDTAGLAKKIIKENGMGHKITIVNKKIEECQFDVDIPEVDIIISEWMGFCLLYEGMLDSVLYARDNFLKSDGFMYPDKARIYIAAINDQKYKS